MKNIEGREYIKFFNEIKSRIVTARIQAIRSVNKDLIKLYLEIGKDIIERQERFGWGKGIVERLSRDLQKEFFGAKGYSTQNLWYMRQFYLEYRNFPSLQQLVGEIPWGQNLIILSRLKDIKEICPNLVRFAYHY